MRILLSCYALERTLSWCFVSLFCASSVVALKRIKEPGTGFPANVISKFRFRCCARIGCLFIEGAVSYINTRLRKSYVREYGEAEQESTFILPWISNLKNKVSTSIYCEHVLSLFSNCMQFKCTRHSINQYNLFDGTRKWESRGCRYDTFVHGLARP